MVTFKSPSTYPMLWNTEAKIHNQENFMCTCLIKGDTWPSANTFLGIGPEISLSLHLSGKRSGRKLVRRSWSRSYIRLPPARIFGSWMVETWLPRRPLLSARARDEDKIVHCLSDSLISKQFLSDLEFGDKYCHKDTAITNKKGSDFSRTVRDSSHPVEEPWLLQSSPPSDYVGDTDTSSGLTKILKFFLSDFVESKSINESTLDPVSYAKDEDTLGALDSKNFEPYRSMSERYYLVEEPWLFQPSVLSPGSENEEPLKHEAADLQSSAQHLQIPEKASLEEPESDRNGTANLEHDQLPEAVEKLFLDEERVSLNNSVSTVILINSSVCTMQRIAVLEDDKLVELLLEPVKENVQCDNIYLGVVKELVPRMKGALVNFGYPRAALMQIMRKKKPFIFPPFNCPIKQRGANDSLLGDPVVNEIEHNSHDVDNPHNVEAIDGVITDNSVEYMQDNFGEHETEEEFDVSEVVKENMNGSVVGSQVEVDLERDLYQLDGCSHDSRLHLQDKPKKHSKDASTDKSDWAQVQKGTKIIVQVVKEGLGKKPPMLTAYPTLRSRLWILHTRWNRIGVSKKISGRERPRLRDIAKSLQPKGFGLTVRTVAAGHSLEELKKDLEGLLSAWKVIVENANSAALAADEGVEGAVPVLLYKAMRQTLSVVQDYFNDQVKSMVVDSPRTYHEVTNYLQEMAPDLCDRVELYSKRTPLFDEYDVEEEISNMLSKRVSLSNGGSLIIEQTEALVSIDVNGGQRMFGQGTSQEETVFDVNLAAAKQIARELRLRDIGGIIVVDFIDMRSDKNKRLVYEEMKKAVKRDRSGVNVSELSKNGLMEITRKRDRPSVTDMMTEPCSCCLRTGRVEALETSFSKIEREICQFLAMMDQKADPGKPKSWPKFILRADQHLCDYLTLGKKTRLAILCSSLKVWILLKVARGLSRGSFELKLSTDDKADKNQNQVPTVLAQPKAGTSAPNAKVTFYPIKKWMNGHK